MSKYDDRKLTKEEAMLLHLLQYPYSSGDYAVPDTVTQEGIRNAIDCDLGYVSRLLKKNIKKGYIKQYKSRTGNKTRVCKAYFLTEKGRKKAIKINEFLIEV